ncbi:MAG: fibronectin type III domain-containing protein, partial [Caldilineaceae bacterium SB0664_bin_27]|nr:fibronectin type III domain-containing protein [Caldilineaceae bacterium SB0664_bin_27]
MQNGTHVPKTRPAVILLLAVILAAVAALSLHTGSATYAQTAAVSTPTAPHLTARSAGANTIELSWTEVPGAARYELHRQEADAPGWQQLDGGNLRVTSFTDGGLTPGVTYQYAVRAIDANGEPLGPWSNFPKETASGSGASTPVPTSTPTVTPAQTATATATASTVTAPRLSARDAGANTIELSWTEVPGAARYELHRQEADAPGWQQLDGGALRGTSFTDRGLTPGVTYQYALRAIDGNGEPLGPWSNFPKETASGSGASTPVPTSTPTVTPAQTATATATASTATASTVTAPHLTARDAG